MRKGIILAGGSGTRLFPSTKSVSKQLLPVYDKPMIYYPLSTLMLANIKEILIISTPEDINLFQNLLGNGKNLGIKLNYKVQMKPEGLAQALIIAEDFLNGHPSVMILGDNIFYGTDFQSSLNKANRTKTGASIFAYKVKDPHRYGVVTFSKNRKAISIKEKPSKPNSDYAVTGLYFYDKNASKYAKSLKPSKRGELEITDLNTVYMKKNKLSVNIISRGSAWLDTGTHKSLLEASTYVSVLEERQGIKIACPEEIAYNKGWITKNELNKIAKKINNEYGQYLKSLIK
ncbi:MAG: glucose-1-phosphate thymidylyltransferase [Candidatus Marinimicrobia bacterium]|nr:glucose-1-phosphate thymidylyltransferase [Candidatus Neomarinimicrobiota bacterium]|tara:strand:+ start:6422 stop:7285 length:864 start_codon:yes stop_codon:yes gene_type:complete